MLPVRAIFQRKSTRSHLERAMDFLGGHYEPLLKSLEDKMYDSF